MDDIRKAQVEAAENAVVERLRQKGLLPPGPANCNGHSLELNVDVVCNPCGSLIAADWVVREEAPRTAILCVEKCRCDASAGWQPIETAPLNESVLIWIPSPVAEHYGPGVYRGLQKQRISGLRLWMTTGLHHGSDIVDRDYQPTRWMPLPESPRVPTANEQWIRNITPDPPESK